MLSVLISWSGGKDSTLALYLLNKQKYEVKTLFTTISSEYNRVSMHGIRSDLLEKQSNSIGIPLHIVSLPKNTTNEEYGMIMEKEMAYFKTKLINTVIFGDIFLEDVRKYRESNLSKIGMSAVFPLWKKDTAGLAREFIDMGFKAIITAVDSNFLDKSFVGKLFNREFLKLLPSNVDPCGENGEFHTFVFDGPLFSYPVEFKLGKIVFRDNRFYYIDLI
jgi:uncharacterized protein (TIGR00290 family)